MESPRVERALISVSDKTGLLEFAQRLVAQNIDLYSTGGTRRHLQESGLQVHDVAEYTGFPEMMDGRVKTLHPKIFGGILGRRDRADDMDSMNSHSMVPFELVVVNLYPFEQTIANSDTTRAQAVEQIDIGGPSLVRAAAKNHAFVSIATSADQYNEIASQIESDGSTTWDLRRRLMIDAFRHTANYDRVINEYFESLEQSTARDAIDGTTTNDDVDLPERVSITLRKQQLLRYGENPHQTAALYRTADDDPGEYDPGEYDPGEYDAGEYDAGEHADGTLVGANQLNGKELSYNNYLDLDSAFSIARMLPDAAAVVIKHNNPCGAASADQLRIAAERAMLGDPISAFGSVLAFNETVDRDTAEYLSTPGLFIEAIVAPTFDRDALEILTSKPKWRKNVRLLELGSASSEKGARQMRFIDGGVLVQMADDAADDPSTWKLKTESSPSDEVRTELEFGWAVCRHVKSNAITISRDRAICGVGAGQMSRVDSVEIAIGKSGERATGAVLASDAFFPFPDSIERAAEAGIKAVIQPGGSKNDQAVIDACNRLDIAMVFTGRRHFRH